MNAGHDSGTNTSSAGPSCGGSESVFDSSLQPTSIFGAPVSWTQLPPIPLDRLIKFLDFRDVLNVRGVSRAWRDAIHAIKPLRFPAVFFLPVEIIQQIMWLTSPSDFEKARRTCRAWYASSLNVAVLRYHLDSLGFGKTDPDIKDSQNPVHLSRRLSRECSLAGDKSGTCGLRNSVILELSDILTSPISHFTVSTCGTHALLCDGCVVYVYRVQSNGPDFLEPVATIVCPRRALAVSMDTSSRRYSVAILLDGRMGLVHDIVAQEAKSTYRNLCSEEDPPRSVAICPQRRCVAFGCMGGIELHWVDALTSQELNRWFPLTAPTDFLYFLPPRHGIDSAKKLRLISSAAHPEETNPLSRRFGIARSSIAYWGMTWEPRAGQSDHFHAVPLSDGHHVLFIDPATGSLCLGSDAPLGGPTKLLRKIWLIPRDYTVETKQDDEDEEDMETWLRTMENQRERPRASVYASGADLRYGVRIAAGYNDRLVFFSVPPDAFHRLAAGTGTGEAADDTARREPGVSPEESITIHGSYVDTVHGLVDLAVDSGPDMTLYAFSTDGIVYVYQLGDTLGDQTPVAIKKEFGLDVNTLPQTVRACGGSMWDRGAGEWNEDDLGCYVHRLPMDGCLSEAEEGRSGDGQTPHGDALGGMVCEVV